MLTYSFLFYYTLQKAPITACSENVPVLDIPLIGENDIIFVR